MGLFGFGKKSVSIKDIDNVVMSYFQKIGSPKDIGQKDHEDRFIEMLDELDKWAKDLNFGDWKRSAIAGSIESTLKNTYNNCKVDEAVDSYMKNTNKIIMKM